MPRGCQPFAVVIPAYGSLGLVIAVSVLPPSLSLPNRMLAGGQGVLPSVEEAESVSAAARAARRAAGAISVVSVTPGSGELLVGRLRLRAVHMIFLTVSDKCPMCLWRDVDRLKCMGESVDHSHVGRSTLISPFVLVFACASSSAPLVGGRGSGLVACFWAWGVTGAPEVALAASSSEPDCSVTVAADEAAAAALAADCGVSVEALSERTEFEQVMVEPSGSQTLTVAAVPQRVRRSDGSWEAIDPTLSVVGGAVVPAATLADVRFSAGGSGPMAVWQVGDSSFTLSWPLGVLPAPRLVGATAVYDGVLPGVNLHVTALREGFSHAVEILTPAAAANPAVRQLRYELGGTVQVQEDADGGLRLLDPAGDTVAVTHAATMWDSSLDPAIAGEVIPARGADPVQAEPATGAEPSVTSRRTGLAVEVDDGGLTVIADEAMLDDPEVTWPVFVDPPFNGLRSKWAYANNANKNWDVGNRAWVGRNSYDDVLYRSFFDFNISIVAARGDCRPVGEGDDGAGSLVVV